MASVRSNTFAFLTVPRLCLVLVLCISTLPLCGGQTSTASPASASDITTATADSTTSDATTTTAVTSQSTTPQTSATISDSTTTTDATTDSSTPTIYETTTTTDVTTESTTATTLETTMTTESTSEIATTYTTQITTTKAAPELTFENFSMVVTLNVRETGNKLLDTIVCVNYSGGPSQVKVNLASVEPRAARCVRCFHILPCLTDWCLNYIPNTGTLDIGRDPVYTLNITCESADGYIISRLLEVRLTTNSPPVFNYTGLLVFHTVPNTRNIKTGDVIYSVNASDADGDYLHYTMTVSPDNGNFQIGDSSGVIRAINPLSQECSQAVTFQVYVSDNINNPVGPFVISTTLNDSNTAPSIINMGELIQVPETTSIGATIYTIRISDESISTISYTLTVVPNQAKLFFSISNHDIKLTSALDYENPVGGYARMTLSVRALDEGGCSSGVKTLYVEVADVNEAPALLPNSWKTTVYEGLIDVYPPWKVQDPDVNDVAFFSFTTASSDFFIDSITGTITSIGDYDLDAGRSSSKTVSLPIRITDRGGKTGTATLTVTILDANDNAPVISSAYKSCPAEECLPVGALLCSLKVSDDDSTFQGNSVTYFGSQSSTYFTVLYNGDVILTSPITTGDYSSATVYAFDQGQYPKPLQSKPAFVFVLGTACTTTTTKATTSTTASTQTTDTTSTTPTTVSTTTGDIVEFNFMSENLPWLMVSALLGTCFIGLLGFMACRYVRPGCTKSASERLSLVKSAQPAEPHVEPNPRTNKSVPPRQDSLPAPHHTSPGIVGSEQLKPFNFWSVS